VPPSSSTILPALDTPKHQKITTKKKTHKENSLRSTKTLQKKSFSTKPTKLLPHFFAINKQTNKQQQSYSSSFLPSFLLSFFLSYLPSSDVHSVCNWVVLQNTNQSPHNNRKRKQLADNTVELSEQIRSQIW
jgi:hypothetical protein